jgi:formylglycine-generating enzyme required for sulfatase activity
VGQEIFYCSKCQVRLRSSDFESGKALRILAQVCCTSCGQEVIRNLPPEAATEFLKGITNGREFTDREASDSSRSQLPAGASPPISTSRIPARAQEPARFNSPLVIGIAAIAGMALLAVAAVSLSSSAPPPAARPSTVAAGPVMVPSPPPRSPEESRKGEAGRTFDELKAMQKSGRVIEGRPKSPDPNPGEAKPVSKAPEGSVEPAKAEAASKQPEPAPAPEPAAKPPNPLLKPARPAVPAAAKVRDAETALRKSTNVDQAKSPKEKSDLARMLLTTAPSSGSNEAELYARLRMARDLASAAGEPTAALQAIDAMAVAFEVDALGEKVALLTRTQIRAQDALTWARACIEVAKQASSADDFDAAGKLGARAESLAIAAKDVALRDDVRERMKEYAEFKREADRLRPFQETLKSAPEDPGACTALGRYLCLIKEEWDKGLPLLAKGSDGALKSLAELELAKPAEAAAQAALGEAWAAQSEKEPSIPKTRAKIRALEWLERALPALSGPAKASAEKRLSQLGLALGSKAPPLLELGGGVKVELIYCKPGAFMMGDSKPPQKSWETDARPVHRVELTRGFFLGKYEVTRGQFAAFVKATGYMTDSEKEGKTWGRRPDNTWGELPGVNWRKLPGFSQTDDDPVLAMSWNDAKAFCDWAASVTRRKVRLPTEAEWEYACRAGTTTPYSFGSDPSKLGEFGWVREFNTEWVPQPVGKKKPNPWGFFDMYGNAFEWCMDFLGPYKGDVRDPEGPLNSDVRAVRGGSYESLNESAQSSSRWTMGMNGRQVATGFRVVVR